MGKLWGNFDGIRPAGFFHFSLCIFTSGIPRNTLPVRSGPSDPRNRDSVPADLPGTCLKIALSEYVAHGKMPGNAGDLLSVISRMTSGALIPCFPGISHRFVTAQRFHMMIFLTRTADNSERRSRSSRRRTLRSGSGGAVSSSRRRLHKRLSRLSLHPPVP